MYQRRKIVRIKKISEEWFYQAIQKRTNDQSEERDFFVQLRSVLYSDDEGMYEKHYCSIRILIIASERN